MTLKTEQVLTRKDLTALIPHGESEVRIDLGCGLRKKKGFIGVDSRQIGDVDIVINIENGLPFDDDSVDVLFSNFLFEHLSNPVEVFEEVYRVCRNGARATITVPYYQSITQYKDPTHRSIIVPEMFAYFGTKGWYGSDYGIRANFIVETVEYSYLPPFSGFFKKEIYLNSTNIILIFTLCPSMPVECGALDRDYIGSRQTRMKRKLSVLFLAQGDETVASSRSRVFQCLPYFEKHGVTARVFVHNPSATVPDKTIFKNRKIHDVVIGIQWWLRGMRCTLQSLRYNILVVQKTTLPILCLFILQTVRKIIIFDVDDAIQLEFSEKERGRFQRLMKITKLGVVENKFMANFLKVNHVPSILITGPIDCDRYKPTHHTRNDQGVVIGWIGSPGTAHYLKTISDPLIRILEKYPDVQLHLIGASRILEHSRISYKPWSLEHELELLSAFDIGIMPLTDDTWSKGKGGYKLLQYMALGIANVASPVGVNSEITIPGDTGMLANNLQDWFEMLELLIIDRNRRKNMGGAARKRAELRYSFEAQVPKLIEAFNKCLLDYNF